MLESTEAKILKFLLLFLEMMIEHHQGAVAMARDELAKGTNPEAKKLAQAVIDGQSAEIAEMRSAL